MGAKIVMSFKLYNYLPANQKKRSVVWQRVWQNRPIATLIYIDGATTTIWIIASFPNGAIILGTIIVLRDASGLCQPVKLPLQFHF